MINFIKSYYLVMICFFISILASFGIIYYSAIYATESFPNFAIAFIFMLIIETGLITLRYISVSAYSNMTRKNIIYDNILIGALFILSVIPATLGTGQKHRQDKGIIPIDKPATVSQSEIYINYKKSNIDTYNQIEKNNQLINKTQSANFLNSLRTENSKLRQKIDSNIDNMSKLQTEYENKLEIYNKQANEISKKKSDWYYNLIEDIFLKFLVIGIQLLNIRMSILGSKILRDIKNKTISGNEDTINIERLSEHEKIMGKIEKHVKLIKEDLEALRGEIV